MIVVPEKRTVLLKSKNPMAIHEVIPTSKPVDIAGHNVAVKLGVEEMQVLRNMGIKAPSPINYLYQWPGIHKPFEHQQETSAFLTFYRKCFVFNEMGTGKTKSVLWTADYLMSLGLVKKALIISPLSTLKRVWQDEIFHTTMHRSAAVLHGSAESRRKNLAKDVDFYIINHDGLDIVAKEVAARKDIDLVIVDEAGVYRNHATRRYKTLKKMLRPDQRLWMMTGTPCPNAPTDAWALARLVDPSKVPEFFGAFKRMTMTQVSTFKWVPKPDSYRLAHMVMQPAIRFKKSDCLDLPPVVFEDRECDLTQSQKHAYHDMMNEMEAELRAGVLAPETVTAVNAADKIGKLRQILCGCVKTGEKQYTELDHTPRLNLLMESIADAGSKAIVIVPFKGITQTLLNVVGKHYSCAIINGDVSINKRNQILKEFADTPDPHVLICHPKVMSHGLNLTEADTLIFYAPIYSNDEYQQVKDRINRPGQKNTMTIIRLGASPLEWRIYGALDSKEGVQGAILDLYKAALES